jgi:hypothetical protein
MPVYLRKFYYRKLVDTKQQEQEQIDKVSNKQRYTPPQQPKKSKVTTKYKQ